MSPEQRAAEVRLLVLDVDGVLSDGSLHYGGGGEESKRFHIADGLGIKLLQGAGVDVAIITGRRSGGVERRARELGIRHLIQGREDKLTALRGLAGELGMALEHIAYMGDDLPDLGAMRRVGLGMTVADGDGFVRQHAHWVASLGGGRGAVREACEFILACQGSLRQAREAFLA